MRQPAQRGVIRRAVGWAFSRLVSIVGGVGQFLARQWEQYTAFGQFIFLLAVVAISVDVGIAFQYGRSMTFLHAAGFSIVALCFCVFPDAAVLEARKGNFWGAIGIGLACIPLGIGSLQSHVGYSSAVRLGDMQQTGFQHTRLENAKHSLTNERASLATFMDQKKILMGEREEIKASGPWVTMTTADALKEDVKVLDGRIADETAGKRGRAAGCKKVCEQLQDERKAVLAKIASVERLEGVTARLAQLDASIEATQRVIDEKTATVAATGYTSSTVVNQNDTFAKMYNLAAIWLGWSNMAPEQAIAPTALQRDITNTATASSASFNFMLAGPMLMMVAGLNRRRGAIEVEHDDTDTTSSPAIAHPAQQTAEPVARTADVTPMRTAGFLPPQPQPVHTREIVTDVNFWREMRTALNSRPRIAA